MLYRFFSSSLPRSHFSEKKNFFSSITSTIKGFLNPNTIQEHNPKLTAEQKSKMKQFLIYRYNPNDESEKPRYISYYVDLKQIAPMYLDALLYVKDYLDPTLSLRRSCREGICGSCAMNCDGLHTLACIRAIDTDLSKPAIITPLGHMFVLKDLVVDLTHFYSQYKSIEPYLKRKHPKPANSKEYYMSIADRKKLDGLYECVMCACCTTSCPSYWWHPEAYLGPAVLQQAYRWIMDTRDEYTEERLEKLDKGINISECQNIGMCTVTCPKDLDPQYAINQLLRMIDDMKVKKAASAL